MKESFINNGFNEDDCEYLIADNCNTNNFDAYTAINKFLKTGTGQFIIIVHQDVRCVDNRSVLEDRLLNLEKTDNTWAVCGNAGGSGYKHTHFYLNDNGRLRDTGKFPAKVHSLDENLLIVKGDANLFVSSDIKDFHFYGTDICIIAEILGYSCYVIKFMVNHLSSGNLKKMKEQQPNFINKYGNKLKGRFVQTSCTKFYLSNSTTKNKLYNSSFIFFWIKAWNRIANNFRDL